MHLGAHDSRIIPIALTIILLFVSVGPQIISATNSPSLQFEGSITHLSTTSITVNPDVVVGANSLSVGTMIDWEWKDWLSDSSLRQETQDAKFKLIRIFEARYQTNGSPDPCISWSETTHTGTFDWTEVDALIQAIYQVGAEPLVCLGFWDMSQKYLPNGMATNPSTGLPYPESYAAYCAEWVKHFKQVGLPVKWYEIVNEPYHYYGWDRSETTLMSNYAELFNAARTAMKNSNPNILASFDATTQKKAFDFFLNQGYSIDFLDIHKYDAEDLTATDQDLLSKAEYYRFDASTSWYAIDYCRQTWQNTRGKTLPIIFSEYNVNCAWGTEGNDPRIPTMFGAVWTALTLRTGITRNVDYMTYYLFASSASSSHGFGMVNLDNNKPWYPYFVQKMIGENINVGDSIVESSSSNQNVRVLSWIHEDSLRILLISKTEENFALRFTGVDNSLTYEKIDNTIPWTNPAIQTGTLESYDLLMTHGYTVAIFKASL